MTIMVQMDDKNPKLPAALELWFSVQVAGQNENHDSAQGGVVGKRRGEEEHDHRASVPLHQGGA